MQEFGFSDLVCTEVMDLNALNKTPEHQTNYNNKNIQEWQLSSYPDLPPTVKSFEDSTQVNDHRILQNLLRNEDKYLPDTMDYMVLVQSGSVTSEMRKIVGEWMLEVVHEQNSQPEVFCLAMNIMDRFLSKCRIVKSQLQLLGSVCLLISSKIREACSISGQTLITYTDYSITPEEIKEWELLVLYKLQWELTAITPMDYLDHTLPRLGLHDLSEKDLLDLRRRTETILVLVACDYQFAYKCPSLLASSAIYLAIRGLSRYPDSKLKEIKLTLQTVTHTATGHIDKWTKTIDQILPTYLKAPDANTIRIPSPDSSTLVLLDEQQPNPFLHQQQQAKQNDLIDNTVTSSSQNEQELTSSKLNTSDPDLVCKEVLDDSQSSSGTTTTAVDMTRYPMTPSPETGYSLATSTSSRSSSPLSAVDIFTDYNTNILQHIFEQGDNNMESSYSILVS